MMVMVVVGGDRPQVHHYDYDNHHGEQDQNDVGHNQDN